jgi:hypothetical protein
MHKRQDGCGYDKITNDTQETDGVKVKSEECIIMPLRLECGD